MLIASKYEEIYAPRCATLSTSRTRPAGGDHQDGVVHARGFAVPRVRADDAELSAALLQGHQRRHEGEAARKLILSVCFRNTRCCSFLRRCWRVLHFPAPEARCSSKTPRTQLSSRPGRGSEEAVRAAHDSAYGPPAHPGCW